MANQNQSFLYCLNCYKKGLRRAFDDESKAKIFEVPGGEIVVAIIKRMKGKKLMAAKRKQQREFYEFVRVNGLTVQEAIRIASFLPREKPKIENWPR